jgi:hypothetical protein
VLANEILLSATPEWWELATADMKEEWLTANVNYLRDMFGPGLLSISVQGDESTPHIQAIGIPVYSDIAKKPGAKPRNADAIARRKAEEEAAPAVGGYLTIAYSVVDL